MGGEDGYMETSRTRAGKRRGDGRGGQHFIYYRLSLLVDGINSEGYVPQKNKSLNVKLITEQEEEKREEMVIRRGRQLAGRAMARMARADEEMRVTEKEVLISRAEDEAERLVKR